MGKYIVLLLTLTVATSLVSGRALNEIGVDGLIRPTVAGGPRFRNHGLVRPAAGGQTPFLSYVANPDYRGGGSWLNAYENYFRPNQAGTQPSQYNRQRAFPIFWGVGDKQEGEAPAASGTLVASGEALAARPIIAVAGGGGRTEFSELTGGSVPDFSTVQIPIPMNNNNGNPSAKGNEGIDRQFTVIPNWFFPYTSGGGSGYDNFANFGYGLNPAPVPVPVPEMPPYYTSALDFGTSNLQNLPLNLNLNQNAWKPLPYYSGFNLGGGYSYIPFSAFPGPNTIII